MGQVSGKEKAKHFYLYSLSRNSHSIKTDNKHFKPELLSPGI